jgi:collagenase-like PrtC family protease
LIVRESKRGADASYFGLNCALNARHRAKNFGISDLPETTRRIRQRRIHGYVTIVALVYPPETGQLVNVIQQIAQAGLASLLMQGFSVVKLVRAGFPDLGGCQYRDGVTIVNEHEAPSGLVSVGRMLSNRLERYKEWME